MFAILPDGFSVKAKCDARFSVCARQRLERAEELRSVCALQKYERVVYNLNRHSIPYCFYNEFGSR